MGYEGYSDRCRAYPLYPCIHHAAGLTVTGRRAANKPGHDSGCTACDLTHREDPT